VVRLLSQSAALPCIEGIFSGTLSFIFNSFQPGMAFSEVRGDGTVLVCAGALLSVEGILSGTISFNYNSLTPGMV